MLRSSFQLLLVVSIASIGSLSNAADNVDSPQAKLQDSVLRIQARIAAEQGDFTTALSRIQKAAELSGDQQTADRVKGMAPDIQGGSPFWNPQELILLIQAQASPDTWFINGADPGGDITPNSQGVFIAAPSVLKALSSQVKDDSHLLKAIQFVKNANHNADVRQSSDLRMVSLVRLDKHVADLLKEGKPLPTDVLSLAGLSRIDYLFVYPETADIVIAGPAGDWTKSADGRSISVDNGRPTLQLDDLVTLTRTFSRGQNSFFMCTIDPKQAQVAAVQEFVNENQSKLTRKTAGSFTRDLEQKLGLQNVFVKGIPQSSRVASVIVDADYRMKEIGIGKRRGPQGMKSYFDLLSRSEQRGTGSMDALRWWMAVGYDAINMSSDGNVFEFDGSPVQCLAEDQIVGAAGTRTPTGKATKANAKFAELFTKFLPELAKQDVVFADMENIFDIAMVAALVNSQGLANQVGWQAEAFGPRSDYQAQKFDVPEELMTAAHHKVYSGGSIVIQVAGGVRGDMSELLNDKEKLITNPKLDIESPKASPLGQQNGRWWWDAK